MDRYSLQLHGKEVWSYGDVPNPEPKFSEVCHLTSYMIKACMLKVVVIKEAEVRCY
jgi:hypothetical protein